MTIARILLLLINAVITIKFFTPFVWLGCFLVLGYVFVLHASMVRLRLTGSSRAFVPALTLMAWTVAWLAFKQGPPLTDRPILDRFPSLGISGFSPNLVGASYIYLKVFDLIRRAQKGEQPPGIVQYATQMMFFPSYMAGPIAGPEPFARGLATTRASVAEGLNRLIGGVLKLYVIVQLLEPANLLAVSPGPSQVVRFLAPHQVLVGLYGSALWIYFNFAGYSDIAIAFGLFMGVRLPENFDHPYLASNPSEFWQRWHMSFTNWLREHIFSPVSRTLVARSLGGTVLALVTSTTATMVCCGLWHRVSLSFLIWGLYHAFVVIVHQLYATRLKPRLAKTMGASFFSTRIYRVLGVVTTFHAITLGWAFFMPLDAPLADRFVVLARLFGQ